MAVLNRLLRSTTLSLTLRRSLSSSSLNSGIGLGGAPPPPLSSLHFSLEEEEEETHQTQRTGMCSGCFLVAQASAKVPTPVASLTSSVSLTSPPAILFAKSSHTYSFLSLGYPAAPPTKASGS
ncbi:hypothetical protein CsSME_00011076 [Camellia sinensis var. sinensis]